LNFKNENIDGYMLGKQLKHLETDKKEMFFKQQLPIFIFGIIAIIVGIFLLAHMMEISYAVSCIIGGIILIWLAFTAVLPLKITVYEQGFHIQIGKRVEIARFEQIEDIGYGIVTQKGKDVKNSIRGYVGFNDGRVPIFLPVVHPTKENYPWRDITDVLVNQYQLITGHEPTNPPIRLPL